MKTITKKDDNFLKTIVEKAKKIAELTKYKEIADKIKARANY